MAGLDVDAMLQRFRDRAEAVKRRTLPPVGGEERTLFIQQAQADYQDYAIIGDAEGTIEDGILVLRVDLRPGPRPARPDQAGGRCLPGSPAALLHWPPHADVAQLVEHHLAKVRVASSSLVIRSNESPGQSAELARAAVTSRHGCQHSCQHTAVRGNKRWRAGAWRLAVFAGCDPETGKRIDAFATVRAPNNRAGAKLADAKLAEMVAAVEAGQLGAANSAPAAGGMAFRQLAARWQHANRSRRVERTGEWLGWSPKTAKTHVDNFREVHLPDVGLEGGTAL